MDWRSISWLRGRGGFVRCRRGIGGRRIAEMRMTEETLEIEEGDVQHESDQQYRKRDGNILHELGVERSAPDALDERECNVPTVEQDRKSTRLNSSHPSISYAVFCL